MVSDQAHEQANAVIKVDRGAIGITEDQLTLRRWMVAGPEVSHLVIQYEAASKAKRHVNMPAISVMTWESFLTLKEHFFMVNRLSELKKCSLRVKKLSHVMTDMGNPFQEDSWDLLSLDTKDIAHASAAKLIATHYEKGRARFQEFLKKMEMTYPPSTN